MNIDSFSIEQLGLEGIRLITPVTHNDVRGTSASTYDAEVFEKLQMPVSFAQEFVSFSRQNVIRGLHFQRAPHAQDKLVRCASGRILDVIADCMPESPTYGKYITVELDASLRQSLYVPGRYAHGFCVLSEEGAIVEYKLSDTYHPEVAGGIRYNDPFFGIAWPTTEPILSDRDATWPYLSN